MQNELQIHQFEMLLILLGQLWGQLVDHHQVWLCVWKNWTYLFVWDVQCDFSLDHSLLYITIEKFCILLGFLHVLVHLCSSCTMLCCTLLYDVGLCLRCVHTFCSLILVSFASCFLFLMNPSCQRVISFCVLHFFFFIIATISFFFLCCRLNYIIHNCKCC